MLRHLVALRCSQPFPPLPRALLSARGTSLVDALIALSIVVTTITGVGHLLLWSRRTVWSTGAGSISTVLADQKLEQLRALRWQVDGQGHAVSDLTTDLAQDPPTMGGAGLRASPMGVLHANVSGFVDYLDADGAWRGTGVRPPPGAAFVRRWAIVPLASDPLHTLILHVVCFPVVDDGSGNGERSPRAVHLTTVRTRSLP